jgi:hypothetical protein
MQPETKPCRDAEVAAASAEPPEQLGILVNARANQLPSAVERAVLWLEGRSPKREGGHEVALRGSGSCVRSCLAPRAKIRGSPCGGFVELRRVSRFFG